MCSLCSCWINLHVSGDGMSGHAKFGSPSTLYRLERCPGSVAFGKDIPEPEPSEYAKEGTEFHRLMERSLALTLKSNIITTYWEKELNDVYPEMNDDVVHTTAQVFEKWQSFQEKHTSPKYHLELKVMVSIDIFGTADVVFVGKNKKTKKIDIVVIDFKYGKGVIVQADENLQGIAYLIGAVRTLYLKPEDIGIAMVIIAQVRIEDGWSQYSIKGKELDDWDAMIKNIVSRVKNMYEGKLPIELSAGSHCRFCKALDVCPEQNKNEVLDISTATEFNIEATVEKLTLDQRARIFLRKQQIEDFLDSVAKSLTSEFEAGVTHPDLKLIQTAGRRSWGDEAKAVAALKKMGVKDPYNKKLKGIGEVEKEIGKGKIDDLTIMSSGKLQLVRAEDKRVGVKMLEAEELK